MRRASLTTPRRLPLRALALAGLLALSGSPAATAEPDASPATVEIVYIEANTEAAVGGHAALRLGDETYHFLSYDDGTLRLRQDGWDEFELWYTSLQNRTLHVSQLDLDPEGERVVRSRMQEILRAQQRHFDLEQALAYEAAFFDGVATAGQSGPETIDVVALGLFAERDTRAAEDPHARALREQVEQAHGARIFERELERATAELREEGSGATRLAGWRPEWGRYPSLPETPAERRRDALARRAALVVLGEARPLAPDALLDPAASGESARPLEPEEAATLETFAHALADSVVRLIGSRRPDRGEALLLTAARYQAVRRSLAAGRLLLLDPFPDQAPTIPASLVARRPQVARALAGEAARAWAEARRSIFDGAPLDEPRYSALETVAARHVEFGRSATELADLRIVRGRMVPSRAGALSLPRLGLDAARVAASAEKTRSEAAEYREAVEIAYGYQLVQRNCSTELARSLNSSFPDAASAAATLGDVIEPGEGGNFIPFLLSRQVDARLDLRARRVVPSYRKRRVAEMRDRENDLWVYLRESNTLTSTVYQGAIGDDAFLFFTDDVFWVRPVYGAVNIGWGIAQAGAGLVTLPWDRGERSISGVRGVFFSLPELAWFNIRKGRFDWVDEP